ncbi:TPA: endonuclease, partial [Citrobacter braakii]|nr:endonuclease [Citrobacter braakii]
MKPTYEELEAKCAALAAENAGLKGAFDKPQAYLSWHAIPPTWEDPLPCGEYLDVHDEAGHKNSDGTDCWPVYAKPE